MKTFITLISFLRKHFYKALEEKNKNNWNKEELKELFEKVITDALSEFFNYIGVKK